MAVEPTRETAGQQRTTREPMPGERRTRVMIGLLVLALIAGVVKYYGPYTPIADRIQRTEYAFAPPGELPRPLPFQENTHRELRPPSTGETLFSTLATDLGLSARLPTTEDDRGATTVISPDGELCLSSNATVDASSPTWQLYEASTGRVLRRWQGYFHFSAAAISPDHRLAALANNNHDRAREPQVLVIDLQTGEPMMVSTNGQQQIHLYFASNDELIMATSKNGLYKVNVKTGKVVQDYHLNMGLRRTCVLDVEQVWVFAETDRLAARGKLRLKDDERPGLTDMEVLLIWDLASGKLLHRLGPGSDEQPTTLPQRVGYHREIELAAGGERLVYWDPYTKSLTAAAIGPGHTELRPIASLSAESLGIATGGHHYLTAAGNTITIGEERTVVLDVEPLRIRYRYWPIAGAILRQKWTRTRSADGRYWLLGDDYPGAPNRVMDMQTGTVRSRIPAGDFSRRYVGRTTEWHWDGADASVTPRQIASMPVPHEWLDPAYSARWPVTGVVTPADSAPLPPAIPGTYRDLATDVARLRRVIQHFRKPTKDTTEHGVVQLIDTATADVLLELPVADTSNWYRSVALPADGGFLLMSTRERTTQHVDRDGVISDIDLPGGINGVVSGGELSELTVVYSHDTRHWLNWRTRELLGSWKEKIGACTLTPDGQRLIGYDYESHELTIRELATGETRRLPFAYGAAMLLRVVGDERLVVVGDDATVALVDMADGNVLDVRGLAFGEILAYLAAYEDGDQTRLAYGPPDANWRPTWSLALESLRSGQRATVQANWTTATRLLNHPRYRNSSTIQLIGRAGTDLPTPEAPRYTPSAQLMLSADARHTSEMAVLATYEEVEAGDFGACALSPDGRYLATARVTHTRTPGTPGLVYIYDAVAEGTPKLREIVLPASPMSVRYSRDGSLLVVGCDDGTVYVESGGGGELKALRAKVGQYAHALSISSDNRYIAAAFDNGYATLWDRESGQVVKQLNRNDSARRPNQFWSLTDNQVYIDPRGRFYIPGASDHDRELIFCSLADGARLGTLILFGDYQWLFFTPDGRFDGSDLAGRQLSVPTTDAAGLAAATDFDMHGAGRTPGLLHQVLRLTPTGE